MACLLLNIPLHLAIRAAAAAAAAAAAIAIATTTTTTTTALESIRVHPRKQILIWKRIKAPKRLL